MDVAVARMFRRLQDFGQRAPAELKRLSRAYFETRYAPGCGYVHNYNDISTVADKLSFLVSRGRIDPQEAERLTEDQIESQYNQYKNDQLQRLERDVGRIS